MWNPEEGSGIGPLVVTARTRTQKARAPKHARQRTEPTGSLVGKG